MATTVPTPANALSMKQLCEMSMLDPKLKIA